MLDEDIMRRLALVRYLRDLGAEQSDRPEPLSCLALLWFHDAIELFLATAAAYYPLPRTPAKFMEYWSAFKVAGVDLPERATVERLNKGRVDLKHHGLLPSSMQIESYRGVVDSFLEAATPLVFSIEFESVSLLHLVTDGSARLSFEEADRAAQEGVLDQALGKLALAFRQLVDGYEDRRREELGPRYRSLDFARVSTRDIVGWEGPKWKDFLEVLLGSLQALDLGLDHARFVKFQMLTPMVHGGWISGGGRGYKVGQPSTRGVLRQVTEEDYDFCRGFAIDAALKIQRL